MTATIPVSSDIDNLTTLNTASCKIEINHITYSEGVKAAKSDIAAGRLVYRWTGHVGHRGHWIVDQFAKRFGVSVNDGFGVCFVSTEVTSFNIGYNKILADEINRQYGAGAFEAVIAESRQQSENVLWAAKRAWFAQNPDLDPGQ